MLGKTLGGRYHIVKHLGGGGFGQTYLASDRQLPGNPLCVVKLLLPQSTDADTLAIARRLFDREAQVLYRLGKHEQIPQLLAHFEEDKEFYLVQEFIEGDELKAELPLGKQLSEAKVIAILLDILKVLEFVHQQDVIHRDIKPSNLIRRQQDGKIFLIDFGAVKQVRATEAKSLGQTTLTVAIGSPGYMPNEQLGGNPKFCSDIYAVGMIGIQALTGIPANGLPFDPETSEVMWRDRANISQQLADVLDKMVRYDYRQRYQTATQTLQALHLVNAEILTRAYDISTPKLVDRQDITTTLPPQTATSAQHTTGDFSQAEIPPSPAISGQQKAQSSAADSLASQVVSPKRKNVFRTLQNKQRRFIGIGASIAAALVLTVGIYHFQKPSLWQEAQNISLANSLTGHLDRVHSVAFSPDGEILSSASFDKTVKLWNLQNGSLPRTLAGHSGWVYAVAFSPDGQTIASGSADGTIKLWNVRTGEVKSTFSDSLLVPDKVKKSFIGASNTVYSVAFSPDGQTIASGSRDKTIKLWNVQTGELKNTLKGHSDLVLSVAISQDGKILASGGYDRTIKLWNLQTGELISTISDPSSYQTSFVGFSRDGQTLVTSSFNTINLWNVGNVLTNCKGAQPCLPKGTLSGHLDHIQSVAISADGETIASGSRDKTIKLWNLRTGKVKTTISNRLGLINCVTFSPDGKTLVSSSMEDNTVKIWRSR